MRILTFTTLYPNCVTPHHGVFVENRLRQLVASGRVSAHVIAPVPWFPYRASMFGRYARYAKVPPFEERFGIPVLHPRYLHVPKLGMSIAPFFLYMAVRPAIERLLRDGGDFDVIDAHYFYPDGVAAALLGRSLGIPVTITARGTDLNLVPRYFLPRQMIRWAAKQARGLVTVCAALKIALIDLGVDHGRIRVLRNGVDLDLFRPTDRTAARQRMGLDRITALSVGHLIPRKGHDLVIRALDFLPDVDLLIVGEGPEKSRLSALAKSLGFANRVRFLGVMPQSGLAEVYSAADVLVLASSREGWPNVLLEAMACGTPVAAARIWGTPEIVTAREAGVLFEQRTPEAIAEAIRKLLFDPRDRNATRAYAGRYGWDATTDGQIALFSEIIAQCSARASPSGGG